MPGGPHDLMVALGAGPAPRLIRAPGRVNLIGEHTDYNDGLVLPMAIDLQCRVAYRPRPGSELRVRSLDGPDPAPLARALADELEALGRPPVGIEAVLASTVPVGAGLASSAAVGVALGRALADAAGWSAAPAELAAACARAEERAMGVPCGIMDQLVALVAEDGAAVLIDCRVPSWQQVPIAPGAAVVVADSGERRQLASSGYADRRAACTAAAARLGLASLRDATPEQVAGDPLARHVVSENMRVVEMAAALAAGAWEDAGRILDAGHASLRDDFGVSTPGVDRLAEELRAEGAWGARLTGAGFGGCVVALAPPRTAQRMTMGRAGRWLVQPAGKAGPDRI
ncbi:MAG: galactokinase [Gaiellales bacterium]